MEGKQQRLTEHEAQLPDAGWHGRLFGIVIKLITIGVILYVIIFL